MTKVHEIAEFREQRHLFSDRFEAGEILASMLKSSYGGIAAGLILAIPSGGVPVGIKVSEGLELPLDLLIVRKLQIPGNSEAGFGAMTLDGSVLLNESLLATLGLHPAQIDSEKERIGRQLEKRNALFRRNRPFPDLKNKHVILVDDGLASGFTMLASIQMTQKAGARETVVAVPTAPYNTIDRILPKVDQVYCANIRTASYFAVAEAYRNWYDLNETEVLGLLQKIGL